MFWHGVLQGEGPAVQIRHDPKNFRIVLHWKHCFCSDKDKEKSFSGACQKLPGRRGGGGGGFQLSNENKASKVSLTSFPW